MNKMKKLTALLLTFALLAVTPLSAMAASGTYIPTAGTRYEFKDGKWETIANIRFNYDKKGRLKSTRYENADGGATISSLKWSGNYVTKSTNTFESGRTYMAVRKFKDGLLKTYTHTSPDSKSTYSYKWKKKKASVKFTVTPASASSLVSVAVKVNGKKQIISETYKYSDGSAEKNEYKYFGNGNMKQYKRTDKHGVTIQKFNKNGYITYFSSTYDGDVGTETYKYTMDKKKKCPKEVTAEYTTSTGYSMLSKTVYTSFKKVSNPRNCDASGLAVGLM